MKKVIISISIISLGRNSIYKTLEGLLKQKINYSYEINIILQGNIDLNKIDSLNKNNISVNIYNYKHGLGFGYYRNEAIKKANGDILAWIDDDEYTKNNLWLKHITKKIFQGEYLVITSGAEIELNKSYLSNCISYLGYPGGALVGFDKMWFVNKYNITKHICTCNFAFHKNILSKIKGFEENLKNGAEDVAFGDMLSKKGIKIYYEKKATIFHKERKGIINFAKWHIKRGKSIYEFKKLGLIGGCHINHKLRSIKHILFDRLFTKYIFGILFMFILQNVFNTLGYFKAKLGK